MSNLQSLGRLPCSTRFLGVLTGLLSVFSVGPVWAGSIPSSPPAQPATDLVLLFDLLPDSSNRAAVVTELTSQAGRPVSLVPPDPLMLDFLRWATPDPGRGACAPRLEQLAAPVAPAGSAPASSSTPFEQLLRTARSQLSDLQLDEASASLELAEAILPCSDAIVTRDAVRTLFLLEAVVHIYKKDGQHRASVIDTLGVDSSLYLGQEYPPRVQAVFLETAQELMEHAPLSVAAEDEDPGAMLPSGGGSAGGAVTGLFVDGQPAATFRSIRPGRHVLQALGPSGQVRTALVSLPESGVSSIQLSTLTTFGLPARTETRIRFSQALLSRQLEAAQIEALEQYLARSAQRSAAFVLRGSNPSVSELRLFEPATGAVSVLNLREWHPVTAPPVSPGRAGSGRVALQLGVGAGLGLVSPDSASSTGAVVEAAVGYALNPRLSARAFGELRLEGNADTGKYPSWTVGFLIGWRVPVGDRWALVPAAGYAGGTGPAAALSCTVAAEDTHEAYVCGAETGEATVWARVRSHGPVARLEAAWRPGGVSGPWSFHVGIDGQLSLVSRVEDGTAQISGQEGATVPYHVGQSDVFSARIQLLAGVSRIF